MNRRPHNRRIDAYRSGTTGEIAPARPIGESRSGKPLYRHVEGWFPVCQHVSEGGEEYYRPTTGLRTTGAGHWYVG